MRARGNVHISEVLPLLLSGFAVRSNDYSGRVTSGDASTALRQFMLERDKGICSKCGTDCVALWAAITWYAENRKEGMTQVGFVLSAIGRRARRWPRLLWEADHIVPLVHGGVRFDPKNLQTLCLVCHSEKSKNDIRPRLFGGKRREADKKKV